MTDEERHVEDVVMLLEGRWRRNSGTGPEPYTLKVDVLLRDGSLLDSGHVYDWRWRFANSDNGFMPTRDILWWRPSAES